jgi:hypothetical protein
MMQMPICWPSKRATVEYISAARESRARETDDLKHKSRDPVISSGRTPLKNSEPKVDRGRLSTNFSSEFIELPLELELEADEDLCATSVAEAYDGIDDADATESGLAAAAAAAGAGESAIIGLKPAADARDWLRA